MTDMNTHTLIRQSESLAWGRGELGLTAYQVHGLIVTPRGTVLAYTEGRIKPHDDSPHHILIKRSIDGGNHWGDNQILADGAGGTCWAQPVAVVDRESGIINLFYCNNIGNNVTDVFRRESRDDGRSWSAPIAMTDLFSNNPSGWTVHMPGPGHGIQLRDGRLLVHLWHRRPRQHADGRRLRPIERLYGNSVLASDDAGATWGWLGRVPISPEVMNNEARLIEMEDGAVHLYMRSSGKRGMHRFVSDSHDRGATWSQPAMVPALPAYVPVDTGFIRHAFTDGTRPGCLLLSHPDSVHERTNMTVRASFDEGASWPLTCVLSADRTCYSDLAIRLDGDILCLYGIGKPSLATEWNQWHPVSVACARLTLAAAAD